MSSTLSVASLSRLPDAGSHGLAGEFASLFGRELVHAFLAADLAASGSLLHEEGPNILWKFCSGHLETILTPSGSFLQAAIAIRASSPLRLRGVPPQKQPFCRLS
jgi:hypothetical protein